MKTAEQIIERIEAMIDLYEAKIDMLKEHDLKTGFNNKDPIRETENQIRSLKNLLNYAETSNAKP